ncbi:MAG: hypothetical protein WC570_02305 [Patescibacteria group bacterium]
MKVYKELTPGWKKAIIMIKEDDFLRDIVKSNSSRKPEKLKIATRPQKSGVYLTLWSSLQSWNRFWRRLLDALSSVKVNPEVVVFTLYFLMVILFTWPLVKNINDYVPGIGNDGGDGFIFLWDIWWIKKQVLAGADLYFTNYLYFPQGVNLIFHTLALAQSLLAVALSYFFGLVAAFNLVYLFFIWLSAVFTYLLSYRLWSSRSGAFISGIIFAFCPYIFIHSLGHFNLTTAWPFPALMYFLYRMIEERKMVWSILAGGVLGFLFMNDYQYFVLAIILLICFFIYYLLKNWPLCKGWFWQRFSIWMVLLMVTMILIFPLLVRGLDVSADYLPAALMSEVVYWSADLMSFVVPSFLHFVWGEWGQKYGTEFGFSGIENYLFVGYTVLVLFVWSLVVSINNYGSKFRVNLRFWQLLVVIFFVLSLGPILKVAGHDVFSINDIDYNVGLPYLLLYRLPFLAVSRVPARFFIVMILALAVVSGYVVRIILWQWHKLTCGWGRGSGLLISIFLTVLIVVEYLSIPISLQPVAIPPAYAQIKADGEESVVLELPLWWSSGHQVLGEPKTIIQYYQTYHEKKILNGSISRVPAAVFDEYTHMDGINYLIDVKKNVLDDNSKNRARVLAFWQDELDIKYIVVHKKYFEGKDYYQIKAYLENILGLISSFEDEGEIVYMINKG